MLAADSAFPLTANSRAMEFARRSVRAVPLTLAGTVGADQTSALEQSNEDDDEEEEDDEDRDGGGGGGPVLAR